MSNQPLIVENSISRATIDALLDPLVARAEQESSKSPQRVDIPVGFAWDDDMLKRIAAVDAEWEKWAEANTALAEAMDDYQHAAQDDQTALRETVRKGGKKHPGTPKSDAARLDLEFALSACEYARQEASRAATAGLANQLKAAASVSQAREAVAKAERDSQAIIASMQQHLAELNQQRAIAFSMAAFVAEKKGVRMSGEHTGQISVSWPSPYSLKMTHLLEFLNR